MMLTDFNLLAVFLYLLEIKTKLARRNQTSFHALTLQDFNQQFPGFIKLKDSLNYWWTRTCYRPPFCEPSVPCSTLQWDNQAFKQVVESNIVFATEGIRDFFFAQTTPRKGVVLSWRDHVYKEIHSFSSFQFSLVCSLWTRRATW